MRLGLPEDFAAYRLTRLLGAFSRSHPNLRLDIRKDRIEIKHVEKQVQKVEKQVQKMDEQKAA